MFKNSLISETRSMLLATILASSIFVLMVASQSPASTPSTSPAAQSPGAKPAVTGHAPAATATPHRFSPNRFSKRADLYYRLEWGVDALAVRWTESGEVIKFTYQVLDPDKAKALNDKKNEPSLIDPRAGVKLVVPSLEKVGQLRQSSTPEAGKFYWMAFSNKGRRVKKGDHVNLVIGPFHADGLVVD